MHSSFGLLNPIEREVDFFNGLTTLLNVLFRLTWKTATYTGEIAALLGLPALRDSRTNLSKF